MISLRTLALVQSMLNASGLITFVRLNATNIVSLWTSLTGFTINFLMTLEIRQACTF